jgi:hypothetical protein
MHIYDMQIVIDVSSVVDSGPGFRAAAPILARPKDTFTNWAGIYLMSVLYFLYIMIMNVVEYYLIKIFNAVIQDT